MNKLQALQAFWESFDWPAYNEASVPDKALDSHNGYFTYSVQISEFGAVTALTASVWQRSTSWSDVIDKAREVEAALDGGWTIIESDDGRIWIKKGNPFYQLMADEDKTVRRVYFNIEVEYFTN